MLSCTANARSNLAISYVPIESLKADARNARVHTKKQVRQIASSIESFGFNVPILIDGENNVVAGHGRILAAKLLGLAEVPTVRLDHLTGAQRRAFAIADNPLTKIASWHDQLLGSTPLRESPMAAGEMDSAAFPQFLETSMRPMAAFSRSGAVHYVCMDWRHATELLIASRAAGFDMLNLCVWTKPNAGMGSFYRSQHELVYVFKAGSGRHQNNVQLGRQGRNRTNVWAYAAGPAFGRAGEEGHLAALHPTVKPVAMVADAILDSSR